MVQSKRARTERRIELEVEGRARLLANVDELVGEFRARHSLRRLEVLTEDGAGWAAVSDSEKIESDDATAKFRESSALATPLRHDQGEQDPLDTFLEEICNRMKKREKGAIEEVVGFIDDAGMVDSLKDRISHLWLTGTKRADADKKRLPVLCTIGGTGVGKTTLMRHVMTDANFKEWLKSATTNEDPLILFATFNQTDTFSGTVEKDIFFAAASRMVANGLVARGKLQSVPCLLSTAHLIDALRSRRPTAPILILFDEVMNVPGENLQELLQHVASVQQAELKNQNPTFVFVSSVDSVGIENALKTRTPRGAACIYMVPLQAQHRKRVRKALWKAMEACERVKQSDEMEQFVLKLSLTVAVELTGGNLGKLDELAIKLQNPVDDYYRALKLAPITYPLGMQVEQATFYAVLRAMQLQLSHQQIFLAYNLELTFSHTTYGQVQRQFQGCSVAELLRRRLVSIERLSDDLDACTVRVVPDAMMRLFDGSALPDVFSDLLRRVRDRMFDYNAMSVVKTWELAVPQMQMCVAHCSTSDSGTVDFDSIFGKRHHEQGLEIRICDVPVEEEVNRISKENVSNGNATLVVATDANQPAIESVLRNFVFRGGAALPVLLQMRMYSNVTWATILRWFKKIHDFAVGELEFQAGKYLVALYVTQTATSNWVTADLPPGSVLVSEAELSRVLGCLGVSALQYHIKFRAGATFGDFCKHMFDRKPANQATSALAFPRTCDFGDEDWELNLVGCLVRFRKGDYDQKGISSRKKPVITLGLASTTNVPQHAMLYYNGKWSEPTGNQCFVHVEAGSWDMLEIAVQP